MLCLAAFSSFLLITLPLMTPSIFALPTAALPVLFDLIPDPPSFHKQNERREILRGHEETLPQDIQVSEHLDGDRWNRMGKKRTWFQRSFGDETDERRNGK
ncbi:hypothetical protein BDW02DRAFT_602397 [Decorospora gaudefroyi]|uniref:Uncharacterized protein n=1 Tax=Decorospora gaudefroyi TaxID=184978 RepID=A0A6A5K0E5_9PLEO|nr:hypothetical protein BDW02DRAFT_602397 [Decorospora gaudefroyi]